VTTNMRNDIEQAALEVGRALAKYEILVANSGAHVTQTIQFADQKTVTLAKKLGAKTSAAPTGNGARKRQGRPFKKVGTAHKVTNEPKAPVTARAARKDRGPRTKGVKERIVSMIATASLTVDDIIKHTGFKATSVRATLMSLKKSGLAFQNDANAWTTVDGSRRDDTSTEGSALSA